MASFAGLVFLLVCFCMLAGRFRKEAVGTVPVERVPRSISYSCIPENPEAVLSLTSKNELSFGTQSRSVQVASILKVASQHGVSFSEAQLMELKNLPFLSTDVEYLPKLLSLPDYRRNEANELQKLHPLSMQQLIECTMASKAAAQSMFHTPVYCCLMIDSEAKMSHVGLLIDRLQAQGINRFNLVTHY
ncbi:biopolymer transporter ExbD [Hymenobacter properus]|uniref:Biopolymer transporter ExbD n=1 Tax=Hymenobacter properus TaxID=2791026 RepID=A0A931BFG3_9BACT|nr:biopolymer transporter ExbD [Hymenobacter properus]MBF9140696.1 biopolymer transporter ExbD [Hymenobacter properus]MBR7719504.1 biopolymer transporter ExbD [Microvirga sp. SRT04]